MTCAIKLTNGHLWKNFGADSAAIFADRRNAQATLAGLSGRGALTGAAIVDIVGPDDGAHKIDGYWVR